MIDTFGRLFRHWQEVQPAIAIDRNNSIERWDGAGEGRATAISFEGFGFTFSLFIGVTPRRDRAKDGR